MRLGICAPPDETLAYANTGIDFVEWPMSRTVGEMDDAAFADLERLAGTLPLVPEAWNVMLPSSLQVVGPEADHATLRVYLERAFSRAAALGGDVVGFGSGGARTSPDGWSLDTATQQFDDACRIAGEIAARHGITIAIEPLNRKETNLVTSVAAAGAVVNRVRMPSVRLLSDLYHVMEERESLADTGATAALLAHVHMAEPHTRHLPAPDRDETVYAAFFETLHNGGYDGRVSLECRESTPEAAALAVSTLRAIWNRVTTGAV